jgi:uncharacterized protein (DUF362 family)
MSRVVAAKPVGGGKGAFTETEYRLLLGAGLKSLAQEADAVSAMKALVPGGRVGLKTNCLTGKLFSTSPLLCRAIVDLLTESGIRENDTVIWERSSRELEQAGYTLNASSFGGRCLGTDATGVGYARTFFNSGRVNSRVSRVLTDLVDHNISLPILKDHSIAGLSGSLKNMYGAINNPNKYHGDNCNPYAAQVCHLPPIRTRHRLSIIDAGRVQYQGGPGYMAPYIGNYGGLILSADPVAADRVGLMILEHLRGRHGQPTLETAGRPVKYLESAEKLGLGISDPNKIDLAVLMVNGDGSQVSGRLF